MSDPCTKLQYWTINRTTMTMTMTMLPHILTFPVPFPLMAFKFSILSWSHSENSSKLKWCYILLGIPLNNFWHTACIFFLPSSVFKKFSWQKQSMNTHSSVCLRRELSHSNFSQENLYWAIFSLSLSSCIPQSFFFPPFCLQSKPGISLSLFPVVLLPFLFSLSLLLSSLSLSIFYPLILKSLKISLSLVIVIRFSFHHCSHSDACPPCIEYIYNDTGVRDKLIIGVWD